ncbi:MAG TPA: tetratricopeptide repeat protein, partial [Candidatus Obscuribacterales bacterium]|nr:tetratricopeptide repeat protein [Candidatus Obscuribacterales bacterium]
YQAMYGYAAPEVGPAFSRARELCQRVGESSQLFAIMWGNWSWHLVRGELKLAMSLAEDMVTFAKNVSDIGIMMEAYVAPAVTSFYLGDFAACRKWSEEAIAEHEDTEHCRIWSTMTGQNSAVHVRTYLTLALFHLGYPEQALKLNEETIEMARQIGHPFSLAHALHFTGWLLVNCRMGDRLYAAGKEELKIASEHGFALWESTGTYFTGAGLFLQGELDESIKLMEKGIQSFRSIAAILTLPGQLGILAEAYIKAGRLAEARSVLNAALELAKGNSDRSRLADLQRLEGALVLLESGDQVAAEKCFHDAIETACSQQSKAMALLGTTSLARLWLEQGRNDEAKAALSTVYGVFEEGFDTEDLLKAKELLTKLL